MNMSFKSKPVVIKNNDTYEPVIDYPKVQYKDVENNYMVRKALIGQEILGFERSGINFNQGRIRFGSTEVHYGHNDVGSETTIYYAGIEKPTREFDTEVTPGENRIDIDAPEHDPVDAEQEEVLAAIRGSRIVAVGSLERQGGMRPGRIKFYFENSVILVVAPKRGWYGAQEPSLKMVS